MCFRSSSVGHQAFGAVQMAAVLPRCCPAARYSVAQIRDPVARVIQSPPITQRFLGRTARGDGAPAQPVGSGTDRLRRGAGCTRPPRQKSLKSTRWVIVWCVVEIAQKCRRAHSIMGIIGSYVMSTLPLGRRRHQAEKRRISRPDAEQQRKDLTSALTYGCAVIQAQLRPWV